MALGIMISRSDPEEDVEEGTADPLDEDALRRFLTTCTVEDDDADDEVTVTFGSGTVFWQATFIRDDEDALVVLDGELYTDEPHSARDVRSAFESLRDLAAALEARTWVEGGEGPVALDPQSWEAQVREAQERATLP